MVNEKRYYENPANQEYLKNIIGKNLIIHDQQNHYLKEYPPLASTTFQGFYVLDDSSFFLGSDYSLCVSSGILSEMRERLVERLSGESLSFQEAKVPLYDSGPFLSGGALLKAGDSVLSSLSQSGFRDYPSRYFASNGEELPPGKIYLPRDAEGLDFSFSYKGNLIHSRDVQEYIFYMDWPMKNGEWFVSSPTMREISLKLDLERSLYFGEASDMEDFIAGKGGALCLRGDSKELSRGASLDITNTIWLIFIAFGGVAFAFLASFCLRRMYKGRKEDSEALLGRGYSRAYLSFSESFSYLVLSSVSIFVCFLLYFLFLSHGSLTAFPKMMFLFLGLVGVFLPSIPIFFRKSDG